ncbi:MAG: hypothetical protein FJ294_11720 [Planctomycetes bacterium]|nr:hypothetical protein [Planctomycetota bacterium]
MKNIILGVALVAALAACKNTTNTSTGDANAPKADCCASKKAESCTSEKAAACEAKTECSGEQKVCPSTGKTLN